MHEAAIDSYKVNHASFTSFAQKLRPLLEEMLTQSGIKFHFVEARAKSVESFCEKITRPGKMYKDPLNEIPDIIGVRIVVYYSDDVAACGRLVRNEFKILEMELNHQPEKLSVDQFGYLSVHYVAALSSARRKLLEWKAFATYRFEIQLRTVLQHSWAAVSHALQYKREGDVAPELRRKLHRLAGLFELADEEFLALRDLALKKARETTKAVTAGKDDIPVTANALRAMTNTWAFLKKALTELEAMGIDGSGFVDAPDEVQRDYFGEMAEHCERLGIRTIAELKKALQFDHSGYFAKIASDGWIMAKDFVLYLLLIGAFPEKFSIGDLNSNGWSKTIAERVINGAHSAKK